MLSDFCAGDCSRAANEEAQSRNQRGSNIFAEPDALQAREVNQRKLQVSVSISAPWLCSKAVHDADAGLCQFCMIAQAYQSICLYTEHGEYSNSKSFVLLLNTHAVSGRLCVVSMHFSFVLSAVPLFPLSTTEVRRFTLGFTG